MSTHRFLNIGSLFVVMPAVLLAATLLLPAQESQPAKETAPEAKASPVAIPADEIPQKASEDEVRLQQIRLSIGTSDQGVEEIMAELPPEADAIRQLIDAPENDALHQLDLSDLASLTFYWESHGRRLAGWQARLQRRSSATSETIRSLGAMDETWKLTRSEAITAEAPTALIERIDSLLTTRAEVESLVQERLSAFLTLQGQVSSQQVLVAEALQHVAVATGQAGRRLLTLDSEPLWTALRGPGAAEGLTVQALQVWRHQAAEISRFLSENRQRARLHAVLFFVLMLAAVILNRRKRVQTTGTAPLDAAAMLLGRPVAASLLVSLVVTRWIYPVLPMSVSKLILLALAVPVLRLLPRLAIPNMRLSVYGLAALFVLDRLRDLAIGQPVLYRLLLLGVSVMGVVLLVRTTLQSGHTGNDRSGWVRLVSGLLRVGAALLGVALVANVAGAVALARLLTGGTLTSTFVAIVLFAAVLVIDAMFTAMRRKRSAESIQVERPRVEMLQRWGHTVIRLGAGLVWLRATLVLFGVYLPLVNRLTMELSRRWQFGGFDVSIGEILSFFLVLAVSLALSRILPLVLEEGVLSRTAVPLGLRATISTLVQFVLMALGFLVALSAAGIGLSQFALLAGALGVGIGFGLQTMVSNFVSGVILAFERPVEVGDIVQVGTLTGRMRHIGLRASIIRLPDGAEVIVPNANLITNEVVNWSLTDRTRRVELPVSVARGTDPKRVVQVLVDAALGQTGALRSPAPFALFRGFGEDSLDFVLYCWSPTYDISLQLVSDLGLAVHAALKQAGIEIALPQRDVHLRTVTPEADRIMAKPSPEQSARRPLGDQMKSSSDP